MKDQTLGWTIKTVSARTGVSVHTLRAWERRYGVPAPRRDTGNRYRVYDEKDIDDVNWMRQQVESGIPPAQASELRRRSVRTSGTEETEAGPTTAAAASLRSALLRSDVNAARHILDEAFATYALENVALQIIQPTLVAIGEHWAHGEATVWQEHVATNLIREKLIAVLQSQAVSPSSVPYLVSACAPEEQHELGLLIFSLVARRRGWRVAYLGQGTPLGTIADLAKHSGPHIVAVSVTTAVGLAGLIPWLDARYRPATRLAFGGQIINAIPALQEHLPGAFLGKDAFEGVGALGMIDSPQSVWIPSRRALSAVHALQSNRLRIAGDIVAWFRAEVPVKHHGMGDAQELNSRTLLLLDLLACALAFDAPDLIAFHQDWLHKVLPLQVHPARGREIYLNTVSRCLKRDLESPSSREFASLLEKLIALSDASAAA